MGRKTFLSTCCNVSELIITKQIVIWTKLQSTSEQTWFSIRQVLLMSDFKARLPFLTVIIHLSGLVIHKIYFFWQLLAHLIFLFYMQFLRM